MRGMRFAVGASQLVIQQARCAGLLRAIETFGAREPAELLLAQPNIAAMNAANTTSAHINSDPNSFSVLALP